VSKSEKVRNEAQCIHAGKEGGSEAQTEWKLKTPGVNLSVSTDLNIPLDP
jgi:hypothetical protein